MKPLILAFLLIAFFFNTCLQAQAATTPLLLDFIDVGEGDSLLIQTPDSQSILIDSGNLLSGLDVLSFIQSQKLSKLNALFLTHPHLDHIGGAFAILKILNVDSVYDNGEDSWPAGLMQDIGRWYNELVRRRQGYRALSQGNELRFGDLKFRVLAPPSHKNSSDWNTNSLVLLLEYGSFRALLMGDANKASEKSILEALSSPIASDLPIQLLKAGHHAAKDTASKAFLKKVHPKAVIVSVNANNINKFPNESVLEAYKKNGAQVFRTDLYGSIRVKAFVSGSLHVLYQGKLKII